MRDYSKYGLNRQLMSEFSPLVRDRTGDISGLDFDSIFSEIQVRQIRASQFSIEQLVSETDTSEATASSIGSGTNIKATATFSPDNVNPTAKVFGVPIISLYQDSVSDANQIYPASGSNVDPQDYDFDVNLDWGSAASDGTNMVLIIAVENLTAGTHDILFRVKFRYLSNKFNERERDL